MYLLVMADLGVFMTRSVSKRQEFPVGRTDVIKHSKK
nr:hypothetical protein [Vibrio mimicus]